ncbi:hypothetical protein [Persephonella sp. KM09-Lau-8]|uniref:hypothetical protein n=1 Tax=Persephonella sp. KM09-Lau-8 TaxID=1158345 RepID=UPI00068DC2E2|nr:hypothetical protein [Persephonella sp. KM09-Lau-8]
MKKLFLYFSFVVVAFLLAGCNVNTQNAFSKEPKVLQPFTVKYGNYVFPVPSNFSLKQDLSMIYENEGIVRAYLVYVGKASTSKLLYFFDKYMPKNGWKKELFVAGEETTVAYSRDRQLIVIKIKQGFGGTVLRILLTAK